MKATCKAAASLLFCAFFCVPATASTRIHATVAFTNAPAQSNLFTVNGSSRQWLTNVAQVTNQITITNSIGGDVTNLYQHVQTYPFANNVVIQLTPSNAVVLTADLNKPLGVSISGTYAVITYGTNPVPDSETVVLPYTSQSSQTRSNQTDSIVTNVNTYASQSFSSTAAALSNYVARSTAQAISGAKSFSGANTHTNASQIWSGGQIYLLTALTGTNVGLTNGWLVAMVHLGGIYSGAISNSGLSNGTIFGSVLDGTRPTNVVGLAGAVQALIGGTWTNATLINPSVSGLSLVSGALTGSVVYLTGDSFNSFMQMRSSNVSGTVGPFLWFAREKGPQTAVTANTLMGHIFASGYGSTTDKTGGRIKFIAQETFTDSSDATAITFETCPSGSSTTAERLRIGPDGTITIGGVMTAGVVSGVIVSNALHVATNDWTGDLALKSRVYSGLVNGNNTGILLGTNVVTELSGGTTISALCSFIAERDGAWHKLRLSGAITNIIANESAAENVNPTYRIKTGTGGDVPLTNQPAWIEIRYSGSAARWELLSWSR